ncbi:MAG: helix-turn-helix transcriptional regulator [bacterium]|nr:helix-turn-helix transcriptional regulator [bacterium]
MDDLNKLITKIDNESPGFKEQVKKRSQEIQIAHQLRLTRESLNLTRKDVAERGDISQQVISKIENAKDDRISLHTLNKYAEMLGCSLKMELVGHIKVANL